MKITEFFEDDAGRLSSTRFVFVLWSLVVLAVWVITSIGSGVPQPLDEWVAGVLMALGGWKVAQKFPERQQ